MESLSELIGETVMPLIIKDGDSDIILFVQTKEDVVFSPFTYSRKQIKNELSQDIFRSTVYK